VDGFLFGYDGFDPAAEGLREALTSTGNGYLCARGTAEWEEADGVHYPGTYVHGGYNRETTILSGVPVLNEDLVNLPNWLVLQLRIEGGDVIRLAETELLEYRHELDIRHAAVLRRLRFSDRDGRETTLLSRRFVSMADVHHGGIEWTLVPENWSGRAEVVTAIDGRVSNAGVARYRQLEARHLNPVGPRTFGPEVIALKAETRQSNLYIGQAARTRVFQGDQQLPAERRLYQVEDYIQQLLAFDVRQGVATRVEKLVTFFTSRDPAVSDTLVKAATSAARHTDFAATFERHAVAWEELWRACDVQVSGDDSVQQLLRLHIAHVLQVCSRNTADLDAGLPARGLNGEAYRGHVFWDEIYAFPFFNVRLPEVTRGLLMYRYRRIGEARAAAREAGFRGAMFPWQSGSEGIEETQLVHLNPMSGRWEPDLSRNQRHVNAAIFYNIWQYYQTTGDQAFLRDYGAEMMLEIARFWASIAHFNPARDRYEIHGVMGPDEFHEKYPDAAQGGLRNNAYTNVMVAWLCDVARQLLTLLPSSRMDELRERLGIGDDELAVWREMSRRMFVPFQGDGIISQFEGYDDLEELDWDAYRATYGNIQRLDRILRAEGKDPNQYKISKQADTVMLFFLFRNEELREIFGRLGYPYQDGTVRQNVAYYDRRTSHGSTLSFVTHAGVLAAIDPDSSWQRFLVALRSDADDIQGGTTKEGIHMGVMSGTLDLVQRCYAGTFVRDGVLHFDPRLPAQVDRLTFPMQFRGTPIQVTLTNDRLTLAVHPDGVSRPVKAGSRDDVRELCPGDQAVFPLLRGDDVGEIAGSLLPGHGGPEPGRHGHAGHQRQHRLGRVVGHRPAVEPGEAVDRRCADHVGQHVREQPPGHRLAVARGVAGSPGRRHHGGDLRADVPGRAVDVLGRVPGVGGVGEVSVVRPEDRPHHRVASAVDLPPAARVSGELRRAPDADAGTGLEHRMPVGDLQHDRVDCRVGEAVLRAVRVPAGQVRRRPVGHRPVDDGQQRQVDVERVGDPPGPHPNVGRGGLLAGPALQD